MSNIVIAALYHFTKLSDHKNLQAPLIEICNSQGIKGSLLLAFEGINGTIAGSRTGIDAVLKHLRAWPRLLQFGTQGKPFLGNPI